MFNKILSVRTLTPSFWRHVPPKPTPDPLDESSSTLKIIHAGGIVEFYYMAVPAIKIMEKYPSFLLARPEIFRRPWDSLVRPEEILTPGQKYFVVPRRTVKKLQRRIRQPVGELFVNFPVMSSSSDLSIGSVFRKEKDEISSDLTTQRGKSNGSRTSGKANPRVNKSGETSATRRHVTFSSGVSTDKSTSTLSENKGVGNPTKSTSSQGHRRKTRGRNVAIWQPTLAAISEAQQLPAVVLPPHVVSMASHHPNHLCIHVTSRLMGWGDLASYPPNGCGSETAKMEIGREEEDRDVSLSPPTMGSMQISGSNGFGHNIEFMSQAYLRSRSSEIDIEDEYLNISKDCPLPIFLKFADVEYKVRNSQPSTKNPVKAVMSKVASQLNMEQDKYKHILKGITGSMGPGEILALMGPSGSGKTTLLKMIGGRLTENVKGTITYNDIPYNPALKRRIGFVAQDDVLFPQLTVEETLVFAAFLRLPSNMSRQQKYSRVETIVKELGLERCRHTRIGGSFVKGLSGGERKRTSIGYEILVDPSLLLLDEPTSGLDSTSANRLVQILQGVAKAGRTIITTIHQPSSRMFHMFDKLLLISEGYPVYYGKARESMEYFSSLRFVPEIAMNPAEFLLDLATGQVHDISIPEELQAPRGTPEFERDVIKYLQQKYKSDVEPKEKEENHQTKKAPEHLQLAVQIKKDWTLNWPNVLHLYFLDIFINLRSSICLPIRENLLGERKESGHGAGELFGAAVLSIKRAGMIASLVLMLFLLTGGYYVQHIPQFMQWLKYISFMYYGFRLLLKVQYSGDQLYECGSKGGCRSLQSSPSFDTVNLNGGLKEVWVLLAMALAYRLCAYACLRRKINICHL
ncbi:hypothetical protein HHK36_005843 [Tetracentron sinense]|uniref:ABC transporter domain-containing protein n=1 Tax=Tetracentron sinense TaxID=13715 RepID=A0A834ZLR3_TETSI|nr:hypothetical protein HHK36_005843 [Tetracentron sinense]